LSERRLDDVPGKPTLRGW